MRTLCGTILAAVATCVVGAADVRDPIPVAKMPEAKHVFSMSCKVTACNGDLATAEGRAKAIAWWKKNNITKLWLESYRHGERVASERLAELRDAFRAEGFEVCCMITPTSLNDITEESVKRKFTVTCWSDPKARERMREECDRVARLFDTVIIDDFLFSLCGDKCARCRADKAARQIADWGEYKRTLMYEVCERDILPSAKKANPNAQFIIKYPCWHEKYAERGYSPAKQAALFGECWIGTETRDRNPHGTALQACWIMAWMVHITEGRCGGGWYDPLDCSPKKFIEQARYTILGGAKESLIHCYDYLLAEDPGVMYESSARSHDCCREFEREIGNLVALAELVRGAERGKFELMPCGVSRHEFRKDGKEFTIYLNTKGVSVNVPETGITLAPHELRICGDGIPRV